MIRKAQEIEQEAQPYWVGRKVSYLEWIRIEALTRQEAIKRVKNGEGAWSGQMEFCRVLHEDGWKVEPEKEVK